MFLFENSTTAKVTVETTICGPFFVSVDHHYHTCACVQLDMAFVLGSAGWADNVQDDGLKSSQSYLSGSESCGRRKIGSVVKVGIFPTLHPNKYMCVGVCGCAFDFQNENNLASKLDSRTLFQLKVRPEFVLRLRLRITLRWRIWLGWLAPG